MCNIIMGIDFDVVIVNEANYRKHAYCPHSFSLIVDLSISAEFATNYSSSSI